MKFYTIVAVLLSLFATVAFAAEDCEGKRG